MADLASSSTASLQSQRSRNCNFHAAYSWFPSLDTPTAETNSPGSEKMSNSRRYIGGSSSLASSYGLPSRSLESRNPNVYTTPAEAQGSVASMDIDNPRFESQYDFQSLIERSPRIIAVMGPTGAGKSTFIKVATGAADVKVGHKLLSCTEEVRAVRRRHPSKDEDIVLVDTPGFDDTFKSDAQILGQIAKWLTDTYEAGIKLSGILYLHRITDNRITNTIMRNLDMFRKLCGSDNLSSIILVTTNWDSFKAENIQEGKANEQQLSELYWKALLDRGSKMLRFENTCSSAWNIIDSVPETPISLNIQREMVDEGKRLSDTAAGRSLTSWLQWANQVFQNMIQRLELLLKGAVDASDHNNANARRYKENLREATEGLQGIKKQKMRLSRSVSSVARRLKSRKEKTLYQDQFDDR